MTREIVLWRPPVNEISHMEALAYLRQCESDSVHTMITSPPYWALRSYLDDEHPDKHKEIGLEDTLETFISTLVTLFREARRVLHPRGTLFVNMGQSYAGGGAGGVTLPGETSQRKNRANVAEQRTVGKVNGYKPKDLIPQAWLLALALQADGWWLRSDIIWSKKNPMPESVTDRPTKSHEYIFLLTKSPRYFYDAEAIREGALPESYKRLKTSLSAKSKNDGFVASHIMNRDGGYDLHPAGRNKRTVWSIATQPQPEAHFACFPEKLIEPCVLAGCPPKVCVECGEPHVRLVEKNYLSTPTYKTGGQDKVLELGRNRNVTRMGDGVDVVTTGWQPGCECNADTVPGITLDMFMGSGTTAVVASKHGRRWMGCELNQEYIDIANRRLDRGVPVDMFTSAGMAIV